MNCRGGCHRELEVEYGPSVEDASQSICDDCWDDVPKCPECDAALEECIGGSGDVTYDALRCPEGHSLWGYFGT